MTKSTGKIQQRLPSPKLTNRTWKWWKWMVGRRLFLFGILFGSCIFSAANIFVSGRGGVTSYLFSYLAFLSGRFQPSQQPRPTPRENRGPEDRGTVVLDEFITTDGELQRPFWKLHSSWPGSVGWLADWLVVDFFIDKFVQTLQRCIQIYVSNKLSMNPSIKKGLEHSQIYIYICFFWNVQGKNKSLESINIRITHVAPWSSGSAKRVARGSV